MLRILNVWLWVAVFAAGCDGSDGIAPGATDIDTSSTEVRDAAAADDPHEGAPDVVADVVADIVPDVTPQPGLRLWLSVPPETPPDATIHISGASPELGSWDGVGRALESSSDGRWTLTLDVAPGTELEFKFTRGSWETVEKDALGGERDNRRLTVTANHQDVELHVASWADLPPSPASIDFIAGVSSAYLDPTRDVVIYTPPGYATRPTASYPVLYLHDGQNLFDPATSAFGVAWEIDDTATRLIAADAITPVIIVGVYNSGDRINEYTPVPDPDYGGGLADAYGQFLTDELKPAIDANYRTQPQPAVTGLGGSSLGGLVSMYLGLQRPDRLAVVSPSVWWADRDIVARVAALDAALPLKIWLDIGTAEGGGSAVDDTRALRDALTAAGWVLGQDLSYREYPGAAHNEAAWAARCGDVLEALYPAP